MKQIYAVFDTVTGIYNDPVVNINDGDAVRGFTLSCVNPQIPESFLSDIVLYHIGDFDELDGRVNSFKPRLIMRGNDYSILAKRHAMEELKNEISEEE